MLLMPSEAKLALGLTGSISDADKAVIDALLPKVDAAIAKVIHYNPQYKVISDGEWYPANPQTLGDGDGTWEVGSSVAHFAERGRQDTLTLRGLPVRSIQEIRVDYIGGFGQKANTFGSNTIWASGTDYWMDLIQPYFNATGHVMALASWPIEPGTVLVKYTCGYTKAELSGRADASETDPETLRAGSQINASDIKQAAELTLVKAFRTYKANAKQGRAGFTSGAITSERLGGYSYSADSSLAAALTGMRVAVPSEAIDWLAKYIHYGIALCG